MVNLISAFIAILSRRHGIRLRERERERERERKRETLDCSNEICMRQRDPELQWSRAVGPSSSTCRRTLPRCRWACRRRAPLAAADGLRGVLQKLAGLRVGGEGKKAKKTIFYAKDRAYTHRKKTIFYAKDKAYTHRKNYI